MYGAWLPPGDDHLPPALHRPHQEIGLALRNQRVILAPDGQDRDRDSWQHLFVLEDADRRHGHEPGDPLGMLGRQRERIGSAHRGRDDDGALELQQVEHDLSQARARPCDGADWPKPGRSRA